MYRPPKRWVGVGGDYNLDSIQTNRQLYSQDVSSPTIQTTIDPALYRYIGKFTLVAISYNQVFTPPPNTLAYTFNYRSNDWNDVPSFSLDITNVNGTNKLQDFLDGMGKFFMIRGRTSESVFRFFTAIHMLSGSTTNNTNFDVNVINVAQRSAIKILTFKYTSKLNPTGIPKPGEEYDIYWYDNQTASAPPAANIAYYERILSTAIDSVVFSTQLSTQYLNKLGSAETNMITSTFNFSTTFQQYSTLDSRYQSSFLNMSSAIASLSSLSTLVGISTASMTAQYESLNPEFTRLSGDYNFSTSQYNIYLSTFNSISTSVDLMDTIRERFRAEGTSRAISSLTAEYPNLSSILLSMTGDPSLYQRGGGVLQPYELYRPPFRAERISTLVQKMIDEQIQTSALSTVSSAWATEFQIRTGKQSTISTIEASTSALYIQYTSSNAAYIQYRDYYDSTMIQVALDLGVSTMEGKKMSLYNLGIDITKKTAELAKLDANIQIADNILTALNQTPSQVYDLYLDTIPTTYAPILDGTNIPSPNWSQPMQIELRDLGTIWKTRDFTTLKNLYGSAGATLYFKYNTNQFSLQFSADSTTPYQGITCKILRAGNWVTPTTADIPVSMDVPNAVYDYITYKTVEIEVNSAAIQFVDTTYSAVLKQKNYTNLLQKYGTENWIEFTLPNGSLYRMGFFSLGDTATQHPVALEKYTTAWGPAALADFGGVLTVSLLLRPFVTTIRFAATNTLKKTNYYSILNTNFNTPTPSYIYFVHKDIVNVARYFRMKFTATQTTTTHQITLEQYLTTNAWGVPEITFPIGQDVPIQLTIEAVNPTTVGLQKTTFETQRTNLDSTITGLNVEKAALEADTRTEVTTLSTNVIGQWTEWIRSTIEVEAHKYTDMVQNKTDYSTLYNQWITSTSMKILSSFVEQKRLSTFNGYKVVNDSTLSTYQAISRTYYNMESDLQSTIVVLQELDSDIRNERVRCSEIQTLWNSYIADYYSKRQEYDDLTLQRMSIAYSSGRVFVPSPEIPEISTMSSFNESMWRYVNQISDLSYTVQQGGQVPIDALSSIFDILSTSGIGVSTVSSQITNVVDITAALALQGESLKLFHEVSQLYDSYIYYNNKVTYENFIYTIEEISSQVRNGIANLRMKEITDPQMSTFTAAGLTQMRSLRGRLSDFMNLLQNEKSAREQFSDLLIQYDEQQYRIKAKVDGAYSVETMRNLAASLDAAIYTCNSYIPHRKQQYDALQAAIRSVSTFNYFDSESAGPLYNTLGIRQEGKPPFQLAPRVPIPMEFTTIDARRVWFVPGGTIPPEIPQCANDSKVIAAASPETRPAAVNPTTTADTRSCGVNARYVDLVTLPGGAFEGIQVIVVDKNGRNAAFGKRVLLEPLSVSDATKTKAQLLTNGAPYSQDMNQPDVSANQVFSVPSGLTTIRIDLGATTEITSVRYMKTTDSTFNSGDITVSLKNEALVEVAAKQLFTNLESVVLDFRPIQSSNCPIDIVRTRRGTCGTMARYVRLFPPTPFPPLYQFQLAQIVVVGTQGQNYALGKAVTLFMNSSRTVQPASLTAGVYRARPQSESVQIAVSATGYLEIDLGAEQDVAAVQIHNQIGAIFLDGVRVQLYTEDFLPAGTEEVVTGNRRKEVVNFTYSTADKNCSTTLRWPSYYGKAGILANGIQLTQTAARALTFGAVKVIDRSGRNIVLFRDVETNPGSVNPTRTAAIQEVNSAREVVTPFVSVASTAGQYAKIMFANPSEVCAIYVYAAAMGGTLGGIRLDLLGSAGAVVADGGSTASFTLDPQLDTVFLDTRYDPDTSDYPTTETAPITRYGQFGLYAQSVQIGPLPFPPARLSSQFVLTDIQNNTRPFTIACYNFENTWKTLDYTNLLATYPVGTPFYFSYNSKFFKATFNAAENDLIRNTTFQVYTNGFWATVTSADLPFESSKFVPFTIQVLLNLNTATAGWIPSNICITDGTGKPIMPLIIKSYTISLLRYDNTWREADYDALLAAYPVGTYFYFMYKYNYFRMQFNAPENPQIKNTTLEIQRGQNAWGVPTAVELDTTPNETSAHVQIVIDVFLGGASASVVDKPMTVSTPYNISILDPTSVDLYGDRDTLLALYGTTTFFNYTYQNKTFRLRFETPGDVTATIQILNGTTWAAVTASDIPMATVIHTDIGDDYITNPITIYVTATINAKNLLLQFGRPFEVNAVLLHSTEFGGTAKTATLIDCNNSPVSTALSGYMPVPYMNINWLPIDFRRRKLDDEYSGPVAPYPIQYGPHNAGVLARYIEIIPKDYVTPLYISQIVAINACGRNVAFMKDVYAPNPASLTEQGPNLVVDGRFEDELTVDFAQTIIYDAYKQKPEADSFKSATGTGTRIIIDLDRFVQKGYTAGDRTSLCNNQVSNGACGIAVGDQYTYNHEINSVIFIAPQGRADEAEGAIVRLIDANGAVVGVQKVTRIVKLFGVDFLDFRRDTSRNLGLDLVEKPRANVRTEGCGILVQYVRVEQVPPYTDPVQLSQLFVIGLDGQNKALYKPTRCYDSADSAYDLSFRAVDGKYYIKSPADGYMSSAGPGRYLEVNLGCPTPVTKVWLVNLNTGNAATDEQRLSRIRIKLYNENRDVIAVQTLGSSITSSPTTPGVRMVNIAQPTEMRTIRATGVDIKAQFFNKKYSENLLPMKPDTTGLVTNSSQYTAASFTAGCAPDILPIANTPYTIGPNRGLLAYFVRVYNPNSYIQISQLLLFDGTGNMMNRAIPAGRVFATNVLGDRYPEYAIDSSGGFFHANRDDMFCYMSEMKPYEYWQVQVEDTAAAAGKEIIGLKYFPPKFNRLRNIGLRFQLLDAAQNVFSEYVLKEGEHAANEFWVDFRIPGPTPLDPLIQYCFPRVQTVASSLQTPIGLTQDTAGNVYVSDLQQNKVFKISYTVANDTFGTPVQTFAIGGPRGIDILNPGSDRTIVVNTNTTGIQAMRAGDGSTVAINELSSAPTGFVYPSFLTIFDSVKNRWYSSFSTGVGSSDAAFSIPALGTPMGMVIRTLGSTRYLYVACKTDFCIRVFNIDTKVEDVSKRIGQLGQQLTTQLLPLSEHPDKILFGGPVGLALDAMNNLYIADDATNSIYMMGPDLVQANRPYVYRVAGTGTSGFSEDSALPATRCMIDSPQCLLYHKASGDILFADMGNGRVRRIRILASTSRVRPLNPTRAPVYPTTTRGQTGTDPAVPANVPVYQVAGRDRETIREKKAPPRIEELD